MSKWNLVVDVALCENCSNCALATKDEHIGNDFPGYAAPQPRHGHEWIRIERRLRGSAPMVDAAYLPTMCNHCDDAPCIAAAKGDAVVKRPDGVVVIDPQKARGRRDLVGACPYGAIWWNEELQLPQKWIFDAHLLDQGWAAPRCVQACPTGAMKAHRVDDAQMSEMATRDGLQTLRPELRTRPRVYYRNLYRYSKLFVGGSVTVAVAAGVDCLPEAQVSLLVPGREAAQTLTDAFGDFKFDRLDPGTGACVIEVKHPRHGQTRRSVVLTEESCYLGEICLGRDATTSPARPIKEHVA